MMLAALMTTVAFALADPSGGAARPPMKTVKVGAPTPAKSAPAKSVAAPAPVKTAAATPANANADAVLAGKSDQAVAEAVLAYVESLTTLSGDFVQTAPSGGTTTGEFYLRRPGQIRFDYDDPSPITIVGTQGMVYVENSELETTDSYPLNKTPLKFLLAKDIDIGDAQLKAVERDEDSIAVTYASTDEETEGELTLILSAPDLAIEQWAVKDAQGGVTVVSLQGVTAGGKLDNRLFRAPEAGGAFIKD